MHPATLPLPEILKTGRPTFVRLQKPDTKGRIHYVYEILERTQSPGFLYRYAPAIR